MRLRHLVVFAVFPLLFCSCRVYLPSLKKFAIDSSHSRIYSKVDYDGILVLGDEPDTHHGRYMHWVLTDLKGIPKENVVFVPGFFGYGASGNHMFSDGLHSLLFSDEYSHILLQTRVVCMPTILTVFGSLPDQVSWIEDTNILFVLAAENSSYHDGDRNLWYPDHPYWSNPNYDFDLYKKMLATDHVIVASSLNFRWDGEDIYGEDIAFSPGDLNVKCGELKENCFSVAGKVDSTRTGLHYNHSLTTSGAAGILSAISFYLSQFYSTPEEIVSVLRKCAIDVGEPGIDEEYGVGLVNLFCPDVLEKEVSAAVSSSQVSEESHALTVLTHQSPENLSLLFSANLGFQGIQGYAGISYTTQSLQAVAVAGFGFTPLGISSSLHQPSRVPFVEVGIRKPLRPYLSLIGTYGYQHGVLSVHSVRTGLQVEKSLGTMRFSVYGGRHFFQSSLGLPGYQLAGARKVSFSRSAWEARFSLSLSL